MLAFAVPACSEEAPSEHGRLQTVRQAATLEGLAGPALSPWSMLGGSSLRTGRSSFSGPQTAATVWEASLRRLLLSRNVRSSPVLDTDGTVLIGSDSRFLFAFHPDGTRKWRVDLGGNIQSTPAITASGTILVGTDASRLHALDRTGAPRWTFRALASIRSSPLVTLAGDIVFGSDDFRVHCLGPDGTERWRFKTWGPVRSSPAATLDGVVYAASNDGNLYALDGATGAERWRVRLGLLHADFPGDRRRWNGLRGLRAFALRDRSGRLGPVEIHSPIRNHPFVSGHRGRRHGLVRVGRWPPVRGEPGRDDEVALPGRSRRPVLAGDGARRHHLLRHGRGRALRPPRRRGGAGRRVVARHGRQGPGVGGDRPRR